MFDTLCTKVIFYSCQSKAFKQQINAPSYTQMNLDNVVGDFIYSTIQ